jgi:hypothetical protein
VKATGWGVAWLFTWLILLQLQRCNGGSVEAEIVAGWCCGEQVACDARGRCWWVQWACSRARGRCRT